MLVLSPEGKIISQDLETARSGLGIKGVGFRGRSEALVSLGKPDANGNRHLSVDLAAINGEAPFSRIPLIGRLVPKGVLQANLDFTISKDGSVKLNFDGSTRVTGFPSWGVYSYGPNGSQPKALLEAEETDPKMLQCVPQEVHPAGQK
jgi:hypothetical protein